ncbi:MAG: hypothetical protein ACI906_001490 [Candidatus Latescibacterota bacterium]|jgi:hypothetical protein
MVEEVLYYAEFAVNTLFIQFFAGKMSFIADILAEIFVLYCSTYLHCKIYAKKTKVLVSIC